MQPRAATKEIIDLVNRGVRNPLELSLRTGKSVTAIRTLAIRHRFELERLPTGKGGIKKMEKELRAKLLAERRGEAPALDAPRTVEEAKEAIVKDSRYYLVLALAYKRVDEHVDKLVKEFPNDAGLQRLKTDLKQASAMAEAKVLFSVADVGELVE